MVVVVGEMGDDDDNGHSPTNPSGLAGCDEAERLRVERWDKADLQVDSYR